MAPIKQLTNALIILLSMLSLLYQMQLCIYHTQRQLYLNYKKLENQIGSIGARLNPYNTIIDEVFYFWVAKSPANSLIHDN